MREKPKRTYRGSLYFAKISVPFNGALAIGKFLMGIFSPSFFLCVNALYNLGIAAAKYIALKTHNSSQKDLLEMRPEEYKRKQFFFYEVIGYIIMSASALYAVFCISMIIGISSSHYHKIVALGITVVTFTEIGLAIRGIVITRKDKEPIIEAIKLTNFASSLISLVLTQTAIMSVSYVGDASSYNGFSGIMFGTLAALIGVYMIIRGSSIKRESQPLPIEMNEVDIDEINEHSMETKEK